MRYGIVGYGPRANGLKKSFNLMDLEVIYDPNPIAQEKIRNMGVKCAVSRKSMSLAVNYLYIKKNVLT